MSQYNSFLLNEYVAKTLGSIAALPLTVPLHALGSTFKATGETTVKGVKAGGDVAHQARKSATQAVGLTKTPEEKKEAEEAKRQKLITKTLKKDPVQAKFMRQAIQPDQKGKTSLNAHLEHGDFDDFLNEVIEERSQASAQRLLQSKKAPDALKAQTQKKLALQTKQGRERQLSTKGMKDKDYDKAIADRAAKRNEPDSLTRARASRPERLKSFSQGARKGKEQASSAKAQAQLDVKGAVKGQMDAEAGQKKAQGKLDKYEEKRARAKAIKVKKWKPNTEPAPKQLSRTERYKADPGYKAAKAEHRTQQAGHYASTEKTKGILGFRKTRGQRTGQMRGTAEAGEEKAAMKARRKGMEGGLARRMLRRATPGGRARMDRMHAKYATPGVGGTPQQQRQTGIDPRQKQAEKESVLQQKVTTECVRGQLDLLIPEVRTRR